MSAGRVRRAAGLLLGAALILGAGRAAARDDKPATAPRVFTNDDLERYRAERDEAKVPAPAATPAPAAAEPTGDGGASIERTSAARRDELRGELTAAEAARDETRARIGKIESLLNPMSTEFEVDPSAILRLQAELREVRARLEQEEAAVAAARAALDAFEDEVRRAGARSTPRED